MSFLENEKSGLIILGTAPTGTRRVHTNLQCSKICWAKKNNRPTKSVRITDDLLAWWSQCMECIRLEKKAGSG